MAGQGITEDGNVTSGQITQKAVTGGQNAFVTPAKVDKIEAEANQFINKNRGDAGPANSVKVPAQVKETSTATSTKATDANTYNAKQIADDVESEVKDFKVAKGSIDRNSKVTAVTGRPSDDATVQGQLKDLMSQFEDGNIPPWAAGAKRNVDAIMNSRGMLSSTMAGAATTQALMESAIQIAVQDASTFASFKMQNLNNRQQARVINAQSFLQMDLTNLSNEQQGAILKTQSVVNAILSDQAQINAAKQFNAESENQTEQFFANMKTEVSKFNAAQKNAVSMFNTDKAQAVKIFNREQQNLRQEFNAKNRLVIDQANTAWRQRINTVNSAEKNEANRIAAQSATEMTSAAYNNLWQRERDIMTFAFTAAENANERANAIALAKIGVKSSADIAKGQATGSLTATILDKALDFIF